MLQSNTNKTKADDEDVIALEMNAGDLVFDGDKFITHLETVYENFNLAFAFMVLKCINAEVYKKFRDFNSTIPKQILKVPGRMDWVVINGQNVN